MKRVSAVIRPEKLEPLKDALSVAGVRGLTIYEVQGCGHQHGWVEYYRGTEVMLNVVPKVKVEFVVNNEQVEGLIDVICEAARTGEVGDGKIFVSPVEECVRIRTGERGTKAV